MLNISVNLILILLCMVLEKIKCELRMEPVVETKLGSIRGLSSADGMYSMFLGIPYAAVPTSNPFGPAVPIQVFENVYEAFQDSAICPQIEEFNNTIVGSLDCLHLNIYVPNKASARNPLPVLVWIYGGAFKIGFGGRYLYGPKFFIRHDIIFITINYRVGPFGFMCLDHPKVPGNQGLKDQHIALKWIRTHIGSFYGDSNRITIGGESAGSLSVHLQMMYNKPTIFDKVIMQSGTAESYRAITEPDKMAPIKLSEYLGFKVNDIEGAIYALSKLEPKAIIAASFQLGIQFRPCVETQFDNVESFIHVHPLNANMSHIKDIPILIGYNSHEYLSFKSDLLGTESSAHDDLFTEFLNDAFNFNRQTLIKMKDMVKHFYIADESINNNTVWDVIDFGSDFCFIHPTIRSIKNFLKNGAIVYHYIFSYVGERNFVRGRLKITEGGAAHADELGYQFDISYMRQKPTQKDQTVINHMSTLWTNFVKYGNPTPKDSKLLKWTPVSETNFYCMELNYKLRLGRRPYHRRNAFWNLFYSANEVYRRGYKGTAD